MKSYILLFTSTLLLLPLISCADTSSNSEVRNEILPSGDILSTSRTSDGKAVASYFSTKPAPTEILAKRMINILKTMGASKSIISFTESRLSRNRRLKNEQFNLPLTDDDGTVYNFIYNSDAQSGLYILNYQFIGLSKP